MNWQPIETAPKDRDILLYFPDLYSSPFVSVGRWQDDRNNNKPRPFWTCQSERSCGKQSLRASPPTHWCEIEFPPTEPKGES